MIVASGFVELDVLVNMENAVKELKNRGLEVSEIEEDKIFFIIRGDTLDLVKAEIESLKDINAVKNVHLSYYSLEDAEERPGI